MNIRSLKAQFSTAQLPFPVFVDGMPLWGFNLHYMKHGYEPETAGFIRSFLKPGHTFIDIGANRGYFTVLASSLGARVVAYEPDPYAFELLKKNVSLNRSDAEIKNVAVSDTDGTVSFFQHGPGSGLNSIKPGVIQGTEITVRCETCDIPYDLCKIDVEGAELDVLRGMKHHGTIICEFRPKAFIRMGTTAQDFLNSVRFLGFKISTFSGDRSDSELIDAAGAHSINLLLTAQG